MTVTVAESVLVAPPSSVTRSPTVKLPSLVELKVTTCPESADADFARASEQVGIVQPRDEFTAEAADYNEVANWLAWDDARAVLGED